MPRKLVRFQSIQEQRADMIIAPDGDHEGARPSVLSRIRARPVFLATAFVVFVCTSILGIEAWRLASARRVQIGESEVAVSNLAKALAEQASGVLIQADALLSGLVERVETDGTGSVSVDRIHRLLHAEMARLTQLHRVSIIDAKGQWITSNEDRFPAGVDHRDREYFQYHQTHADAAPHLGPPIESLATHQWVITVSRRFNDARGQFAGVVVASIVLDYFNAYYEQFDLGRNGSITLVMSDGTILDRRPWKQEVIGTSLSNAQLFKSHIAFDDAGVAWITSAIDGVERLSAFQKVNLFPAYAIASFSREQVLADWFEDAAIHGGVAILLVVVLAVMGRRLVLQIAQRHRDQTLLLASQAKLESLNASLENLAREDGLTGLPNRREFDRVIAEEIRRVDRSRGSLAIVMIDIDHFKAYNDHFGHPQGDVCIRAVAEEIRQCVTRPGDMAARYGGEEFVVLLPATHIEGAHAVAERISHNLRRRALPHPQGPSRIVTISMGISVMRAADADLTATELVNRADKALYAAKQMGRDRISAFAESARPHAPGAASRDASFACERVL